MQAINGFKPLPAADVFRHFQSFERAVTSRRASEYRIQNYCTCRRAEYNVRHHEIHMEYYDG